jgi:hypothetical protein
MSNETDFEKAREAKAKLKEKIKHLNCAIGIGRNDNGFVIAVRVRELTPEIRSAIPDEFEGFEVEVKAVGQIRPR